MVDKTKNLSDSATQDIANNVLCVRGEIAACEKAFSRRPGEVCLLAVSKTKPARMIRAAVAAGCQQMGENYLQEALEKQADLADLAIEWHFIGAIQSRKAKDIALHFDWVHTVDRLKVAEKLNQARPAEMPPLNVLIQVNLQGEAGKAGVSADDALVLAKQIIALPQLKLRGLMLIPKPEKDFDRQRAVFAQAGELFGHIQQQIGDEMGSETGGEIDQLSMGMSGDLHAAIAEGATMVRIGTAIFGARAPKPA